MARRWAGPTRAEYEEVLSSEQVVDMARLRGYARHGVEEAVRGDVWMHLLGVLAADTAGEASAVRAMLLAWADTPVAHPAQLQVQQCAFHVFLDLSRSSRRPSRSAVSATSCVSSRAHTSATHATPPPAASGITPGAGAGGPAGGHATVRSLSGGAHSAAAASGASSSATSAANVPASSPPSISSAPPSMSGPDLASSGPDAKLPASTHLYRDEQHAKFTRRITAMVGAFLNTHPPPEDAPPPLPPFAFRSEACFGPASSDPGAAAAVGAPLRRSLTPVVDPEWPGSPPQADDMDLDWAIPRTGHQPRGNYPEGEATLLPSLFSPPDQQRPSISNCMRYMSSPRDGPAPAWWSPNHWHPALVYLCAPLVASIEADAGAFFSFEALMARLERRYIPCCGGRPLYQRIGELLSLFRQTAPSLFLYFQEEGINLAPIVTEWLQTLLAKQLPLEDTLRLWDTYFALDPARGDEFTDLHTYVCVAILAGAHDLLEELDKAEALAWLNHLPHQDITQIVNDAINLRLSHRQQLAQQRTLFQQRYRSFPPPASNVDFALSRDRHSKSPHHPAPSLSPRQQRPHHQPTTGLAVSVSPTYGTQQEPESWVPFSLAGARPPSHMFPAS